MPQVGEVVLLDNQRGYVAALDILEVTATIDSDPNTFLAARYRILTDKSRDFSEKLAPELAQLAEAAVAARSALNDLEPSTSGEPEPGIGHNKPPADAALSPEDYNAVNATLQALSDGARGHPSEGFLRGAQETLSNSLEKIAEWGQERFRLVRDGFYRQLGGAAALALLGAWAAMAGKLEAVGYAILAVGRVLFGWH